MYTELGAGIVGGGFVGGVHAAALRLIGATVVGVVGSSPDGAERLRRRFDAAATFRTAEHLIDDPRVDVIHICTPNISHYRLAHMALEAGKHVVCEKPLTLDVGQADELVALAAREGLVNAVPLTYRYLGTAYEARRQIRDGRIGRIHTVRGSYLQDWMLSPLSGGWRVDADLGGPSRAFADIGTHWCDLMEWIGDQHMVELTAAKQTVFPERVAGRGQTFDRQAPASPADGEWSAVATEDVALVMFRTDQGALGSTAISQVAAGVKNQLRLEFDGTEGRLVIDSSRPELLWSAQQDRVTILQRDPQRFERRGSRTEGLPAGHATGYVEGFAELFAEVYEAVRAGDGMPAEPAFPTFADGRRSAVIVEAMLRSSAARAYVEVR